PARARVAARRRHAGHGDRRGNPRSRGRSGGVRHPRLVGDRHVRDHRVRPARRPGRRDGAGPWPVHPARAAAGLPLVPVRRRPGRRRPGGRGPGGRAVKDRLTEIAYATGWRLVRTLPRGVTWPVFAAGADLAARRPGGSVRRLAGNLRRVVGPDLPDDEFATLLRTAVRSYARYWLEAFRLPSLTPEQRLHGFELGGSEMLGADVASGRGAIVALPHAGNGDAAGA